MSTPSILHRHPLGQALPAVTIKPFEPEPAAASRERIWNLSPHLHCSIIGTCLTTGDLRQLFAKLNEADARTASDHALHGRAVRAAARHDIAGKLLNKMLEKRHEGHIKRFAKAASAEAVRRLWTEALERGDIPGAYWAALTHPATDQALLQDVFGDVHMLSHLVGMSNRADIARLRHLERDLADRDDKIARQEARLQKAAQEAAELNRRVAAADAELRRQTLAGRAEPAAPDEGAAALARKLADERVRNASLAERIQAQDAALRMAEQRCAALEDQAAAMHREMAALEALLGGAVGASADGGETRGNDENGDEANDLAEMTVLYVGGRPKLVEQLRALVARRGGVLLDHDGGAETRTSLLPGLISQADIAFFPVDCVSHQAAWQVKRLCREARKPFVPLRSASVASFAAAIQGLSDPAAVAAGA